VCFSSLFSYRNGPFQATSGHVHNTTEGGMRKTNFNAFTNNERSNI